MNRLINQTETAGVEQRHAVFVDLWETTERKVAESPAIGHGAKARGGEEADVLKSNGEQHSPNHVRFTHD